MYDNLSKQERQVMLPDLPDSEGLGLPGEGVSFFMLALACALSYKSLTETYVPAFQCSGVSAYLRPLKIRKFLRDKICDKYHSFLKCWT